MFSSSDYFKFTLYDASNNNLGEYVTGRDLTANLGISLAGTYYLKLGSDYFHDSGQYSLTTSFAAGNASGSSSGSESESNDTTSTADSLTLGNPIKGQLSTVSDTDYYKFTTSGSGSVSILFDAPTNSSWQEYFRVTLYDASNNSLGEYETGQDLTASLGIAAAGTYYLKVDAPDYYYDTGQYSLTTSFSAGNNLSGASRHA